MPKIRHPLSGSVYDMADDGLVVVEKDGQTGRFDRDGNWISGDIRTADPELCRWVSDPRAMTRQRQGTGAHENPTAQGTTGGA